MPGVWGGDRAPRDRRDITHGRPRILADRPSVMTGGGGGMAEPETPDTLRDDLRTAWHRFVDTLVPLRPALHRYCRRLAGNVWDAEDLAQETLLRAFGRWGVTYPPIREPR